MGYSESDAVKLKEELQNYYSQAETLMMKPEGYKALKKLLPLIDLCYDKLLRICEELNEKGCLTEFEWRRTDVTKEKENFDCHVNSWFTGQDAAKLVEGDIAPQSSVGTKSNCTRSSTASEKLRSQVRLEVASAAMNKENTRVCETRFRARQRAEKLKLAAREEANIKQRKAEAEAQRILQKAKEEAEAAERQAMHEIRLKLQEVEDCTEKELEEKKLEWELAKVEADARSKNVSDSQEKPHYHAKDLPSTSKSKGPFVTFKPSKEPIRPTTFVPPSSRSLTDLPFLSRDIEHSNHQEHFATKTLARSPQRNFQSFL